jgi:pSer/pThr/pTyr-binding forkhead associated (FHA) protein
MAGEQMRVLEGKEPGRTLSVDAKLLIGRAVPTTEGRLGEDPEMSRRHAQVSRGSDGRLRIEDLGSANGTFVNGERLNAPRTLEAGDVVKVGRTVLQVTGGVGVAVGEPPAADDATRLSSEPGEELVVTGGAARGLRLTVRDELVIGRRVSGEGKFGDDHELSRRHARIARNAAGELTIEDLGSANGTLVNGRRVTGPRVLELGDTVRMGSTILELTKAPRAPAPAPAEPSRPRVVEPPPAAVEVPFRPAESPRPPVDLPRPVEVPPAAAAGASGRASGVRSADGEQLVSELPLGSVFAGCRVEAVIGHGDMGIVYRADELALQRPVALKLILPGFSREERFRERFRRESRVAAAIDHQNVIPIFDAGDEAGRLYITMRLVEGTDLRALIAQEGWIEPLRAARIVRQVGAALDAAHARGMVHRDVKPSNVLLGRGDHAYLSDFGLAKDVTAVGGGLTRHGSIVARAEYVAPEQILNQRVDARADVYALGCLLFETLTGEPPFARWKEGHPALAHLDAPRPSVVAVRPDLPREFDEVVRTAMAKDPGERYPSGGDLGQAALVAAGGLRRARPWSVVATGEAAFIRDDQAEPEPVAAAAAVSAPGRPTAARAAVLQWAVALAALVIVAVGMVAALHGISTL